MQMAASVTTDTYLLLGTNMGDRAAMLTQALEEITEQVGPSVCVSSIYETAAWGNQRQPQYLNQVVQIRTALSPLALLEKTQAIEKKLGRNRHVKWEARLIDIDILFYGDHVIDEPDLQVPHPYIAERNFTLIPLAEIAPMLVHPTFKKTVSELLGQTTDRLPVHRYQTATHE